MRVGSLVAHWKLDGDADDAVGGNDGTVHGNPVWTVGQVDGALDLDGNGDYVDCGNDSSLNLTNNFSISAWFNVNNTGPVLLICKGNMLAYQSGGAYTILCVPSNGMLGFYVRDSSDTEYKYAIATIPLNEWTHVVGTFSDGDIIVYKNGTFASNGDIGTPTIHSNDGPLGIGAEGDGGMPFDGMIDDVRIYDQVLNEPEIRQMASCITITYSNVHGGWPGEGNIDVNPCFVEPGYWDPNGVWIEGDYHLLADSPCIDAADNNSVPADANDIDNDGNTTEPIPWDLDGRPRFADGDCNGTDVVDMGAYEFAWAYIGDFNGECDVDFADFAILGLAWLTEPEDAQWNPDCDISEPNIINFLDFAVLADNWLAGQPPLPGQASNPNPADGATGVSTTADLSWTAGAGATSHDVYFSTGSPPPFIRNRTAATFDPETMTTGITYYWSVDGLVPMAQPPVQSGGSRLHDCWTATLIPDSRCSMLDTLRRTPNGGCPTRIENLEPKKAETFNPLPADSPMESSAGCLTALRTIRKDKRL